MPKSKATGCIKTGARVHFSDYGVTISADVFRVGNCIAILTWPEQLERDVTVSEVGPIDLTISARCTGNENLWRKDRGVFVVPEDFINFHKEM